LIVLGIIGIVAQMTIPTLMQSVQNQVYVTSVKKAYTNFNQVLTQLTTDYGCIGDLACTGLFSTPDHLALGNALVPYFKIIKNCTTTASGGCFTSRGSDTISANGTNDWDAIGMYKFITADGMSYMILNLGSNCASASYSSTGATGNMAKTCAQVWVDVNGPTKAPSRLGRDIFVFYVTNGKGPLLYPYGGKDHYESGASRWWKNPADESLVRHCATSNPWGAPCAGRIMEEGWQMNY